MPLRFGLYGLEQHVGVILQGIEAKPHLIDLVGVADPYKENQEKLREIGKKCGVPTFQDYRDLIGEGIQVLGLCIVNNEKAPVICDCLNRGVHVVTDKPLTTTLKGLGAIEKSLQVNPDSKLSMLLTLRGDPQYRALKEIVEKGQIGNPITIYAKRSYALRRSTRPEWLFDQRKSGGIIVELAVHDVDFILWTVKSAVERIDAFHGKALKEEPGDFQDHCQIILQFENDAVAFIDGNRLIPEGSDCRVHVVGSKGTAEIRDNKVYLLTKDYKGEVTPTFEAVNVFLDFIQGITENKAPLIGTKDVIEATRMTLEARAAAESH